MNIWNKFKRNTALRFLDRCVLRPSRDRIPTEDLIRYQINHEELPTPKLRRVQTEAYLFTTEENPIVAQDNHPIVLGLDTQSGRSPAKPHPHAKHLVLKFPGTGGRAERGSEAPLNLLHPNLANTIHPPGQHVEAWTWNPPGYGQSTQPAGLEHLTTFAHDFARQVAAERCGPDTMLWIAGNSLGCLSALHLAASLADWLPSNVRHAQIGCWLRNPPDLVSVLHREAARHRGQWLMRRAIHHMPPSLHAIESAARCEIPAVFLSSQNDELVLPELQDRIHKAYAGDQRVFVLAGLDHGGLIEEQHVPLVRAAAHWLADQTMH